MRFDTIGPQPKISKTNLSTIGILAYKGVFLKHEVYRSREYMIISLGAQILNRMELWHQVINSIKEEKLITLSDWEAT